MVDLLDIVEELENWDAGVGLILRGAENKSNIFCSGGDLKTVHEISGTALPMGEYSTKKSKSCPDCNLKIQKLP